MVLQRRLDYGFSGYQVPWVPRASRSPRGRGSCKKKLEDNRVYAFEVLATLAGKLLQEREASVSTSDASRKDQHTVVRNTIKCETHDQGQQIKLEPCDQGSCDETLAYVPKSLGHLRSYTLNELPHENNNSNLETINFDPPENACFSENLTVDLKQKACGSSPIKIVGDFPGATCEGKIDNPTEKTLEAEPQEIGGRASGTDSKKGSLKDPKKLDRNILAPVHSDSNFKASLCSDHMTRGPSHRSRENIKVAGRDDDEKSSGCSQPGTIISANRPAQDVGNRKIRKLSASRCWRVASNLKDGGFLNNDGKRKPIYWTWKTCYPRQRSRRISPFKRRKLLDGSPEPKADRGFGCEGMQNSHNKGKKSDNGSTGATSQAGGVSSSVGGQQASSHSRDCNVKLSIKSFRVPELFIEIPATATVGSLKRTVMEAVTAVLGDGLRVGILLQGKTVGDDSKTLLQTGISQVDKLCSLGFMLEPRRTQIAPPLCAEDPSLFLHDSTPQHPSSYSATSTSEPGTSKVSPEPPISNLSKCVQRNLYTALSHADIATDKTTPESRALVAVPAMSLEPLAMVPFHQKSRRSEFVQRRIRRPFSVSEVEALVQAVENLGTGRWRDVKLRAFDGAKHRTYVDLKDKWKTLVHTAKISPQQRRGEPVPQELLDRVLAAHAYWSEQQAKQQQLKAAV